MTFVKFTPAMPDLFNIMNNAFDRSPLQNFHSIPASNIYEDENGFTIEMAVPGFKKENFKIEVDNHRLTISAEAAQPEGDTRKVHRREFQAQSFSKTFTLSEKTVDESKIDASYENGVLTLMIAKREEAKPQPARMIAIS
ncbi:MAG: Hsp20/alpha crystallin family protein [Marinilabiliaceae bacterium]|nr:Hsp20/alpha crystallin family protein [Marinilabiliaceae bacterium]